MSDDGRAKRPPVVDLDDDPEGDNWLLRLRRLRAEGKVSPREPSSAPAAPTPDLPVVDLDDTAEATDWLGAVRRQRRAEREAARGGSDGR